LMLKFENVATPLEAVSIAVPDSDPDAGFVPIPTVIDAEDPVTVFPCASCTVTCTAGEIDEPATVSDGCTLNANFVAAPAVTVTLLESASIKPVAVNRST
jgi:hypothetical protein